MTAPDAGADGDRLPAVYKRLVEIRTDAAHGTTVAATAMAAYLRAAGIDDVQLSGPTPERQNLVARLHGNGAKKPMLLLAHLDVVDADEAGWSSDPWKLVEKDGYFYGRGTIDDKAMAAIFVSLLIELKREGFQPDRDVIVALTADEEDGEHDGVAWLLAHQRERIDAAFAINEGGGGDIRKGKYIANLVQTSEKLEQSFVLETRDVGGDSGQPGAENAIVRLARAIDRVSHLAFTLRPNELTRTYFKNIAAREEASLARDMRTLGPSEAARVAAASTWYGAMLRTTCETTLVEGGHGEGAMPQSARATLNCRILSDGSSNGGVDEVERAILDAVKDPKVQVTRKWKATLAPPSPRLPELFQAVERISNEMWPGVVVTESMLPSATDGKYLRAAGIPTYGVSGLFEDVDDVREHGVDERIGVRQLAEAATFLGRLVRALAAPAH